VDEEFRRHIDELSEDEFQRLYGRWAPLRPPDAAVLLAGLDAPWWIAGGWAIEAFTGIHRPHDDLDIGVFERDVPAVVRHVLVTHHVWAAGSGMLCPILAPTQAMPAGMRQLWIRESATRPWLLDVLVTPHDGDRWTFHRDRTVIEDVERVMWVADDGLTYLRPEVALASKAALARPKDTADLDAALALLDHDASAWLGDVLRRLDPAHPWLVRWP
jgi:hypothetical protein